MDTVEDELHDDVAAHERRPGEPGLARRERTHRVEDMCHGLRAARERLASLHGGCVRVAARHCHAPLAQQIDELESARKLRRQGHVADRAGRHREAAPQLPRLQDGHEITSRRRVSAIGIETATRTG